MNFQRPKHAKKLRVELINVHSMWKITERGNKMKYLDYVMFICLLLQYPALLQNNINPISYFWAGLCVTSCSVYLYVKTISR